MFGRNGRIGLIVPANNATIEPEMWPSLPADTALFSTRILAKGDLVPDAVKRMETHVDRAVDELTATVVDTIAYADMVTTFIMDEDWNDRRIAEIGATAGVSVYTAWTAMRAALDALGVRRIALLTPYPAAIHASCSPFLERNGYTVATAATLDIVAMTDVPKVDPEEVRRSVKRMDRADADAVMILATDLPTFAAIEAIEVDTGLPVLTSNQTMLWQGLALCGQTPQIDGLGRLLSGGIIPGART